MKTNELENGTFSITLELPDKGQCTLKTECKSRSEVNALAKAANLDAIELLAKADKLSAQLIRKLTISGAMTLAHAIEEWKGWIEANANSDLTAAAYKRYVDQWYLEHLPERLMDVTEELLSAWVNKDDGTKASTRGIRLAALRSFFGYCADKEYLSPNPALTVRIKMKNLTHAQKETREKTPFTDQEINKLLDHIWSGICAVSMKHHPKWYEQARFSRLQFWNAVIRIGRLTGLRLGDICSLEWECFSDTKTLTVWTDKRDKRVVLPITDELKEALGFVPPSGNQYCFPAQRKMCCDTKQRHKLCVQFAQLLKSAGVPGHSFHDMRHTRATELWNQGMPIETIAELLGHSSVDVTKGYIHRDFEINLERESAGPRPARAES